MQFIRFEKTMDTADHVRFYEILLLPQACHQWQIVRYYGSNQRRGGQYRIEMYPDKTEATQQFDLLIKQRYRRQYHPVLNRNVENQWQWQSFETPHPMPNEVMSMV